MSEILEKIKPNDLIKILDAYMQAKSLQSKDSAVNLPAAELSLANGNVLSGVIISCDFNKNQLILRSMLDRSKNKITFINFSSIMTLGFYDMDLCPEFLEKLSK